MKTLHNILLQILITFSPAHNDEYSGFNGDHTYIDNLPVKNKMPYEK